MSCNAIDENDEKNSGDGRKTIFKDHAKTSQFTEINWSRKSKRVSLGGLRYCNVGDGWVSKSCRLHGSLCMRQKSENSDRFCAQRLCCKVNQNMQMLEGLHKRIVTRRMSAEVSTLSLAIGAYMRRVEWLDCRHCRLRLGLACAMSRGCMFQGSSGYAQCRERQVT